MFQERFSLETPEHVPVEFEVAGPMARFAAALLDGLILFVGGILVFAVIALAAFLLRDVVSPDILLTVVSIVLAVVLLGYFPAFELLRNGQTPGKMALGIRVMRRDMAPLDFGSVFLRGILRVVDVLPGLPFPLVGLVSMTVSERALRLGDLVAGTWVVRDPDPPALLDPWSSAGPRAVRPRPAAGPRAPLGEGRLSAEEFRMARDFVQRAPGLDVASRRAAAAAVAGPVLQRLGERRLDAERFLREEVEKGSAGKSLL
jgi:uncharacterized RDD family membrane protein YckC